MNGHDPASSPSGARKKTGLLRTFVVCCGLVAVSFLTLELVLMTRRPGTSVELLQGLRVSLGALAAVITVVAMLHSYRGHVCDGHDAGSPKNSKTPWRHRVQHVHLRTKILVPLLALSVIPTVLLGTSTIYVMRDALWNNVVDRVAFETVSKGKNISVFLHGVEEDLRFLSQLSSVKELVLAEATGDLQQMESLRRKVEREFMVFSRGKRAFYQVRYLNHRAHEVVRLNVQRGVATVVAREALQDKSDRYYVKEAFALEQGDIYCSPIDLNVERGTVEQPSRTVVRFATRVIGEREIGEGVLVINLYGDFLLSLAGPLNPGTRAWLVDGRGTATGIIGDIHGEEVVDADSLLAYVDSELLYPPSTGPLRGVIAQTKETLFFSAPVLMDLAGSGERWTLLMSHPRSPIETPIRQLTTFLLIGLLFTVSVAISLGVFIGNYLVQPITRLRRATQEIAGGNLSAHVHIETGDEIEGLAADFNTMAMELSTARERLSSWNVELEREVEHQTENIRVLQAGLSKADKLAAIGQITASVMHEVGNPLAAIKTKVQAAQEEGNTQADHEELLPEILEEVDRLTTFLRSFSHLGSLPRPVSEVVAPPAVIQEVATLIGPDLKRRKLHLRLKVEDDVPPLRGDGNMLRQLLINLILNAADASPEGSDILVRARRAEPTGTMDEQQVLIEVVDQGHGMTEEICARILEPFFTTKAEGTGLGLAICKQVVEEYHGTMDILSKPEVGTTISMCFPVLRPGAADEEVEDSGAKAGALQGEAR